MDVVFQIFFGLGFKWRKPSHQWAVSIDLSYSEDVSLDRIECLERAVKAGEPVVAKGMVLEDFSVALSTDFSATTASASPATRGLMNC